MTTTQHALVAVLQFTFGGPVSEKDLQDAIMRAMKSKQFRLLGSCTIVAIRPGEATFHPSPKPTDDSTRSSPEPFR